MRIEQSELYDNVLVSKFCAVLKRYKTVKKHGFLGGGVKILKKNNNSHHVPRLTVVDF